MSHGIDRRIAAACVAAGGFAGATARHAVALALPDAFPWGTLAVNVLGSVALGLLVHEAGRLGALRPGVRLAVGAGFLASFTTYSTFAVETAGLPPAMAGANVAATYGLGLLGVVVARRAARTGLSGGDGA